MVSRFSLIRRPGVGPVSTEPEEPSDAAVVADLRQEVAALTDEVEALRTENRRLHEWMLIDPATGLPNRPAFEADLLQLQARLRRSGDAYSVLLIDLDSFHHYNESFGIEPGDRVIATVAQTVHDSIRLGDRTYRYDGDQFAILLPGATMPDAVTAGERVRSRVESLGIEMPLGYGPSLTVTVAVVEAGFRHADTKELLIEVTRLLIDGKCAGRNRVVWPC